MTEQKVGTEEFLQRMNTALAEAGKRWREETVPALTGLFTEMRQAVQPIIESTLEIAQKVSDAVRTAYIEDGAIYGDTHEGLMRWLNERGEINRLRNEAERIEQHQAAVRDFKHIILKKAVTQPVDGEESE